MQKVFGTLIGAIIFTFVFNSLGAISAPNEKKESDEAYYLYAVKFDSESEAETPQDETDEDLGGLLSQEMRDKIRIINLGPIVNFEGVDYAPTISADGKTLYYVSNRPGSKLTEQNNYSHDFWSASKADRLDTIFNPPINIDTTTDLGNIGVNTPLNEGAASIAADGQTLYFTGCNRPDGFGDCDLYESRIEGKEWKRPFNLGKNVNSKWWDSQPSISPFGDRIYFTSNRPGPFGKENMDIWYAEYDFDLEEWKPAVNLESINTKGKEVCPFIGADNRTLFFASDGHEPNLGGLDFFVTRFNEKTGKWSKPANLLDPINTKADDYFITMPAAGDVLYFSSRRKDKAGYQGDLDVFMAFIPTFFRSVVLKVQVVDECSDVNIPAALTVKNPITGRTIKDTLTLDKTEFTTIISIADYGSIDDPADYVNFEIHAVNEKYGETAVVQRIDRPSETIERDEVDDVETEYFVKLTLGQKPVLAADVDQGEYIRSVKARKPELADYDGLVMKEVEKWDLYPLLNYVFFDLGSTELPPRYIELTPALTKAFTDTTIPGGTMDKYYNVLNIYGYRLNKFPDEKITIVGCNDNTKPEEKADGVSKGRAQSVYDYFKNVWNISEDRMKIEVRNLPKVVSNLKDSLGIVENRRVEILSDSWDIMKPVFDKDPVTFPQPEMMKFLMKNGIEDKLVKKRRIEVTRGGNEWITLGEVGITDPDYQWDWLSKNDKYPEDEVPFTAKLVVTTVNDAECASAPIEIPVMQVKILERIIDKSTDSTEESYNLILFPFDRYDAGPINLRIMNEYVYDRIFPSSVVEVIGHTDVVGMYDHNKRLSENRAKAVYNGITKKVKGNWAELERRGVGEDDPLYDNSLPEGRFYNRTVQVKIKTPLTDLEKYKNLEADE